MTMVKHFSRSLTLLLVLASAAFWGHASANAQVYVRGYYRSDGTYVRPHYRSKPDNTPLNNWSYPGNVNPYTGKVATGNPNTYLKKYKRYRSASSPLDDAFDGQRRSPSLLDDMDDDDDIDMDWP